MEKMRKCPKCGKIADQYTFFCTECGTKTIEKNGNSNTMSAKDENISKTSKSGKRGTIICFASGLLFILAVVVIFVAVNQKDKNFNNGEISIASEENAEDTINHVNDNSISFLTENQTESSISDLTLQGNYTNWGNACCDSDKVYFSDFSNGIYCSQLENFSENSTFELIANGFYSDLGIIDDYILSIKMEGDFSYVVRINKFSYVEEIVSEKYNNTTLTGQDIVDGKFFYTVGDDRLMYINNTGEECSTPYRNVLKMSQYGVFTTSDQECGLEYTAFENESTRIIYKEFSEKRCVVAFSGENIAVVCDYTDGPHGIYELDLVSQECTPIFEDIIHNTAGIMTTLVNSSKDRYLLSVTYQDEQGRYVGEIYRYLKTSGDTKQIFSTVSDELFVFSASSILKDDIIVTSFPLAGTGKFYINYIE